MQSMKRMLHPVFTLVLLGLCSCVSKGPTTHMAPPRVYGVAPKDMIVLVKQAIATEPLKLGVAQDEGSAFTTTWREGYQGNYHITRYWQERTQFRINIIPDWENPQTRCRIEVTEATEERSNRRGEWRIHGDGDTFRPERCEEVLTQIEKQLPAGTKFGAAAGQGGGATPAAMPQPVVAGGWSNGTGSFTTAVTVAEAGRRVETVIKAMQLEVKQSKLTAIDGNMVAQGATGPEIGITIQLETSGATRVTVSQLGNQNTVSANPQLVFAKLRQDMAK